MPSTPPDTTAEPAKSIPTGLPNEVYDLVLVLQQAAADAVRYSAFSADADAAGDQELSSWFAELADSDREIVQKAGTLLVPRLTASLGRRSPGTGSR